MTADFVGVPVAALAYDVAAAAYVAAVVYDSLEGQRKAWVGRSLHRRHVQ